MKNFIFAVFLIFSAFTSADLQAQTQTLKPFTSDQCSKWPEGTNDDPSRWADCCFTHDMHYWIGGTEDERKSADIELKECVKLSGSTIESFLMYTGVRAGGKPGDQPYSWGYGWETGRGYEKIPAEDLVRAKSLLESSKFNKDEPFHLLINQFINEVLVDKIH